jgi:hypothetical protein
MPIILTKVRPDTGLGNLNSAAFAGACAVIRTSVTVAIRIIHLGATMHFRLEILFRQKV